MKKGINHALFALMVLILLGMVSMVPGVALAQCGSPATSTFPSQITVCPSGDISLTGQVLNAAGQPCIASLITMIVTSPCACNAPYTLAALTNLGGWVTFTPRSGGFCTAPGLATYTDASGVVLGTSIMMNSPDIDGNCTVNLTDVALFSQSFFTGVNLARADYNYDGILNLIDITILATHIGH